jgi:serine/threonine protein kinase
VTISVGQTILEKYRIDEYIGKGSMASVYKVWDLEKSVPIAMKVLNPDLAEDKVFLRRFTREAQTLASLQHPNIIRFYGIEQDGEDVFITMDYIDGITLRKHIFHRGKPFSTGEVLNIMKPVCAALSYAHKKKLIHCDVKPANIMIDQHGKVYLSDFGISRLSETATATMVGAGTPAYMAPEQILGKDPKPQTDIYALGIVMYEMLTGGERPFTGENSQTTGTTAEKVRWEQLKMNPLSPSHHNPLINRKMDAIVLRCLGKDADVRYTNTLDLLAEINEVEQHDDAEAQTPILASTDERLRTNQESPHIHPTGMAENWDPTDLRTKDENAPVVIVNPLVTPSPPILAESTIPFNKWINGKFAWLSLAIITLGWAATGAVVWPVMDPSNWWDRWGIGQWALATAGFGLLGGLAIGLLLTFTLKLKLDKTIKITLSWAVAGLLAGTIGASFDYAFNIWRLWIIIGTIMGAIGSTLTCFLIREDLGLKFPQIVGISLSWTVSSMLGWFFSSIYEFRSLPWWHLDLFCVDCKYSWFDLLIAGAISGFFGALLTGLILNRKTLQGWKKNLSFVVLCAILSAFASISVLLNDVSSEYLIIFSPLAWLTVGFFINFVISKSAKQSTPRLLLHMLSWGAASTAAFIFCTFLYYAQTLFLMWFVTAVSLGFIGAFFDGFIEHGSFKMNWLKVALITAGWALGGIFTWVLARIFTGIIGMEAFWDSPKNYSWQILWLDCGALMGAVGGYLQSLVMQKYRD